MAKQINRLGAYYYEVKLDDSNPSYPPEYILNVGATGKVTISGNLDVLGDTTSIGSSELIVDDNTITVGYQDPAGTVTDGMALGFGGIIFDRGTRNDANFFFDESLFTKRSGGLHNGSFIMQDATGDLQGLYVSSVRPATGDDLYLMVEGTGVVTVSGTADYEKSVFPYLGSEIAANPSNPNGLENPTDDDALVNARALIDYVNAFTTYNFQYKISVGSLSETKVEVIDQEDDPLETSRVQITVDGVNVANFFENRFEIESLLLNDNSISPRGINEDIIFRGTGTGTVQVDDHLNLTIQTAPTAPVDGIKLWSNTEGDGGTGLFFINQNGTTDEVISRNKALLYSIIF